MDVKIFDQCESLVQRASLLSRVLISELDEYGIQGMQTALYEMAAELTALRE